MGIDLRLLLCRGGVTERGRALIVRNSATQSLTFFIHRSNSLEREIQTVLLGEGILYEMKKNINTKPQGLELREFKCLYRIY